jgi:predicted TPR repeat methyltransferase
MAQPTPAPAVPAPHPLLAAGMAAHQSGRAAEARAAYGQLLAEQPEHPDAHHLLGLLEVGEGHVDPALALLRRAVELRPAEPMFHNNLGNLLQLTGRLDEAERHYIQALELDPSRIDVLNNAALLQARRGDLDAAIETLTRVVGVAPEYTDARHNLVGLYLRAGKLHEAIDACSEGLITSPRHPGLRRMLGIAYSTLGKTGQAIEVYRNWLADEPGNAQARHHLAGLTGEDVPEQAAADYVRQTFKTFAASFDAKLAQLGYRAPQFVASALERRRGGDGVQGRKGGSGRALAIADAGCGTGLCAPLLAPWARHLVGVDLSGAMLEQAQQRGGYDELVESDLVAFLQARPRAFDVVVSADTLCYFGRLDQAAAAARASLVDGGLLVFTVEAHPDEPGAPDYRLHHHGRYSHRLGYVQAVLGAAGFEGIGAEQVVLRQEGASPVNGWLIAADAGRA